VIVVSAPVVSLSAAVWLKDIDVFGFYVPSIAAWALLAVVPFLLFRWLLLISRLYRFVWHRALFNLSLYLLILSFIVLGGGQGWL
jgi:hypothetical protein